MAKKHRLKEIADLLQTGAFQLLAKKERSSTDFGKIKIINDDRSLFDMTLILEDKLITYRVHVTEINVRGGG